MLPSTKPDRRDVLSSGEPPGPAPSTRPAGGGSRHPVPTKDRRAAMGTPELPDEQTLLTPLDRDVEEESAVEAGPELPRAWLAISVEQFTVYKGTMVRVPNFYYQASLYL